MEKQTPNKQKELKPIKLTVPKLSKGKKIWYFLTWWRPLTKKEGKNVAFMLLKLSEAILNLEQTQQKLVQNNNAFIRQFAKQGVVPAGVAENKKPKSKPKPDIMFE